MNKREKISLGLAIAGVVWYFAENIYFGWNMKPQTPLEGVADFMIWVFWVLAFFIKPSRVENHTHEQTIETQTVNIYQPKAVNTEKK